MCVGNATHWDFGTARGCAGKILQLNVDKARCVYATGVKKWNVIYEIASAAKLGTSIEFMPQCKVS